MSELRVGVVGVGKMGLLHAGIFNQLESSALVAVAEKDGLTSNLLKAYLPHIRVYSDYEKMFKREELDIAVITTPVFLHKPIVEVAREHDCHVFVEKPLALDGDECRSVLHLGDNAKTQVGYNRRFLETFAMAKRIVDDSSLGELKFLQSQMFETQVLRREQGWRFDRSKWRGGDYRLRGARHRPAALSRWSAFECSGNGTIGIQRRRERLRIDKFAIRLRLCWIARALVVRQTLSTA